MKTTPCLVVGSVLLAGCRGTALDGGSGGATTLAHDDHSPSALLVDESNVYWVDDHTFGGVFSVPKAGGPTTTLFSGDTKESRKLGADGGTLFFASRLELFDLSKSGGAPRKFVEVSGTVEDFAVGNGRVVWASRDVQRGVADERFYQAPASGGDQSELAVQHARNSAIPILPQHFTVAGNEAWATTDYGLLRIPLDGGAATTVILANRYELVALDETHAYSVGTDTIDAVPLDGGPIVHLAPIVGGGGGLAIDRDAVYFGSGTTIQKVPKAGGAAVVVALAEGLVGRQIVVDDTFVYWIAGQVIQRAPK